MAKINIDTAYIGSTFILAGKNLGPTIERAKITGIEMVYHQEEKELWITYNKKVAIVPYFTAVIPDQGPAVVAEQPPTVIPPKGKVKAQASSPVGHVFEGEGHGLTGQEGRLKK